MKGGEQKNVRKQMVEIFSTLDDFAQEAGWKSANAYLERFNWESESTEILLTLLMASWMYPRDEMPNFMPLLEKTKERFEEERGKEEAWELVGRFFENPRIGQLNMELLRCASNERWDEIVAELETLKT